MSISGTDQTSTSNSIEKPKINAKARLRNLGDGVIEFDGVFVRFYVLKGRFRKQRELALEISVADVEGVDREGNELNVTSKGIVNHFVIDKAGLVDEFFEDINKALETQKTSGAASQTEPLPEAIATGETSRAKKSISERFSIKAVYHCFTQPI